MGMHLLYTMACLIPVVMSGNCKNVKKGFTFSEGSHNGVFYSGGRNPGVQTKGPVDADGVYCGKCHHVQKDMDAGGAGYVYQSAGAQGIAYKKGDKLKAGSAACMEDTDGCWPGNQQCGSGSSSTTGGGTAAPGSASTSDAMQRIPSVLGLLLMCASI